ncbi:hypothetical protein AB0F13_27105 [Streptomyces sp. NPDC026206]|uniref:hypothetical protein n=1 Tax=Streptomyces sp. NPDC026206 TaxID=3157089 RepID=UPI0033C6719C
MRATTTAAAGAGAGAGRGGPGLRGPAWLVLRQHRSTAWFALGGLIALLALLVTLRFAIVDYVDANDLEAACTTDAACKPAMQGTVDTFRGNLADPLHYIGRLIELLPVMTGAFVAGPLIARELESGTYKLAWTQSLSPLRWLAVKLAVPGLAVLAGLSLLSAVYTWVWRELPVGLVPGQWWFRSYDMVGPVPVAQSLLALAVGAVVGLLLGRTVAAMGATALTVYLVTGALGSLRQKLTGPVTELSADMPELVRDGGEWFTQRGMIGQDGGRIAEPDCGVGVSPEDCLAQHGATGWYVDYHPASHLWPMQWAEAGITVALAGLVGGAAFWLLRRRCA